MGKFNGNIKAVALAIRIVAEAAAASVGKLEQTIGRDIREKIVEGKACREELFALAEEAYREVKSTLSESLYYELCGAMDSVELFIRNTVEAELLKLKSAINKHIPGK